MELCLLGVVKWTKNADIDKYVHSGYGIGFDRHEIFSFPVTGLGRNVIIFGLDMSSSTKIDNRKRDISILGKGLTQGLEHTLSAEKMYSIKFTEKKTKNFVWACIIIKKIITYLLMAPKLLNLNQMILKFFHIHYA